MRRAVPLAFVLLCALCGAPAARAADLRVAASADLQRTLAPIVAIFERLYPGVRVITTYDRADSLAARVRAGAPYDVFVGADSSTAARLDADGFVEPGTRRTFAYARVALWARKPTARFLPKAGMVVLATTEMRAVALPNPAVSAFGAAAKEAIEQAKQWDVVKVKVLYGQSDPLAADLALASTQGALLSRGEAESPALKRAGRAWVLPDSLCAPIPHAAAVMAGRDSVAKEFVGFLGLGPSRDVLVKRGYFFPAKKR